MAFAIKENLLGKIGSGGGMDFDSSSSSYADAATRATSGHTWGQEDPGPTVGGAIGSGFGSAMTMAGTGAMLAGSSSAALSTMGAAMGGPVGLAIGAGIGILSHIFS